MNGTRGLPRPLLSMDVDLANIALPALPTIRSDSLRNQVFTHRSLHARSTLLFEDPEPTSLPAPDGDNERLEFLGDSILHFCATLLLHRIFPRLKCGPATAIRGIMLSNRTFAGISKRYRLIEHILSDPNNSTEILSSSKIQGAVTCIYDRERQSDAFIQRTCLRHI